MGKTDVYEAKQNLLFYLGLRKAGEAGFRLLLVHFNFIKKFF